MHFIIHLPEMLLLKHGHLSMFQSTNTPVRQCHPTSGLYLRIISLISSFDPPQIYRQTEGVQFRHLYMYMYYVYVSVNCYRDQAQGETGYISGCQSLPLEIGMFLAGRRVYTSLSHAVHRGTSIYGL